jgi:hypothetical protein
MGIHIPKSLAKTPRFSKSSYGTCVAPAPNMLSRRPLIPLFLSISAAALVFVGAVTGCAAPTEDDADDSAGALEVGAVASKFEPGTYGDNKVGPFVILQSTGSKLYASIKWQSFDAGNPAESYDHGYLDVPLTDRSTGTNDETGPDGDGGVRCGFTIKSLGASRIHATSDCDRGDLELSRSRN